MLKNLAKYQKFFRFICYFNTNKPVFTKDVKNPRL